MKSFRTISQTTGKKGLSMTEEGFNTALLNAEAISDIDILELLRALAVRLKTLNALIAASILKG